MSGHHKWSEIKHKRNSIVWTGDNIEEFDEFANNSQFGYVVGSNYHNYRWYHSLYAKLQLRWGRLPEWVPADDLDVLEIYPDHAFAKGPWHWTTLRIGDRIYSNGTVERDYGRTV